MSPAGTVLVTGANGGLGSAIVSHILKTPDLASRYTGLYAVRKAATASNLQAALKGAPPKHNYETLDVDLGSLASVKAVARDVNERVARRQLPPIRALILNAGYHEGTMLTISADGFDTTWQVNFLANLVLSLLLLQSMDKECGRILIMGSWTHDTDDPRNYMGGNAVYKDPKWHDLLPDVDAVAKGRWSTPQDDPSWLSGSRRYGSSKLCATMLMHGLSERLAKDAALGSISVVGMDPGGMPSDLGRRGGFMVSKVIMGIIVPLMAPLMVRLNPNGLLRPTWKSAADAIRASFEVEVPSGKLLYLNGSDEMKTAKDARDEAKRQRLWRYALGAADIGPGDTVLAAWQ